MIRNVIVKECKILGCNALLLKERQVHQFVWIFLQTHCGHTDTAVVHVGTLCYGPALIYLQ